MFLPAKFYTPAFLVPALHPFPFHLWHPHGPWSLTASFWLNQFMHKGTHTCMCIYKISSEICGDRESRHSFLSSTGCGVTFQIPWKIFSKRQSRREGTRFRSVIHLLPFGCRFSLSSRKLGEAVGVERNLREPSEPTCSFYPFRHWNLSG